MPINKDELTKEMLEKAMQCKTAEELMAYLSELEDFELDGEHLKTVAGGAQLNCWGLGSCPKEGPQTLQGAK